MSLVTAGGIPTVAKHIKDRLHEIDPRLGLAIVNGVSGERWCVTYWWGENDPRWEQVLEGRTRPEQAFDPLVYLPADCPPEQAYGYLVNNLKAWSGSRADIKALLDRVHHFNAKAKETALQETRELAEELLTTNAKTLLSGPKRTSSKRSKDHKRAKEFARDA